MGVGVGVGEKKCKRLVTQISLLQIIDKNLKQLQRINAEDMSRGTSIPMTAGEGAFFSIPTSCCLQQLACKSTPIIMLISINIC